MGSVADNSCALNEEMTRCRSMCRSCVFNPKNNERMNNVRGCFQSALKSRIGADSENHSYVQRIEEYKPAAADAQCA